MKQVLPIFLKYFTFGFLPFHNSYGVFLVSSLKYTLLTVWHVVLTASPHKFLATSLLCNMALAISWITLFFLSTTPFCWGGIGAENSWDIPDLVQKDSIYEFSNSLPWSFRIRSIFRLFSFYNFVHKASMCSGASNLDRRSMTQVYLVMSSTTTMMYLFPPRDSILVWPIRSRYSSSNGLDVAEVWVPGCLAFVYLPSWHGPHTTLLTLLSFGIPKIDSCLDTIERCL